MRKSLARPPPERRYIPEEILSFFDGLELLEPGLVFNPEWRPAGLVEYPLDLPSKLMVCGVGRKP